MSEAGCREAITHLKWAGSDESYRTLIACTKSRIYASNDSTGNWRILADTLGGSHNEEADCLTCHSRRFRSAQLGNYILFTNDFDQILSWQFGDGPTGVEMWSAKYVVDLQLAGISRARCITEFNGFVILGDVEIEGEQKSSRIYWSDYNSPLAWLPSDQSLANYHEFGLGEKVLRVEPLGKYLMVYTDKALYQGVYVGDTIPDLVFQFTPIPTDNPLRYEHSLINTGVSHIYAADTGIYEVTASYPRPSRMEWVHRCTSAVYGGIGSDILGGFVGLSPFSGINKAQCDQFVSGYNALTEEIWFSWPTGSNICPNMSLVLNMRYQAADLVDHGFTAFSLYKPDLRPTVRDWLNEQGICLPTDAEFIKEGMPMDSESGTPPSYLWNEEEDPTMELHPDSWCSRLGDVTVEDLCETCESSPVFVMADALDFTLKEYEPDTFFRESYNGDDWDDDGYYTLLQSDMSTLGAPEEKTLKQLLIDFDAGEQEPPSDLVAELAYGAQPRCSTWKNIGSRELRCLTESTASQHEARHTRPDLAAKYPTFYRGRFLGYRIWIAGMGGQSCFSRVVLTVQKAQARTH